jgi:hypothetical protein
MKMNKMPAKYLFAVLGILLAAAGAYFLQPSGSTELSFESIQECLAKGAVRDECLDVLFRDYLEKHTTPEALALMRQYEAADAGFKGGACHPAMHSLGRETFRKLGTVQDSFAACDQTCHSGCYHGAMERFLRGEEDDGRHVTRAELEARSVSACDPEQEARFRFQCLHGLGHAILFFSDFDLAESLRICARLPDAWSARSCAGGVFMENVFSSEPAKRDLSQTDYHYPCRSEKVPLQFREECYVMQTSRMTEMGLDTKGLFAECRRAGEYAGACAQSIGRDISNIARSASPRAGAGECELGAAGEERQACIRGSAYALIDNTWNGRDAFPFCAAFGSADDRAYCFRAGIGYLTSFFEKTAGEIEGDCRTYAAAAAECRI